MLEKNITLRCECGSEAVVFTRYDYDHEDTTYDISVEDSYIGGDYKGFFGRLKRAWRAFIDKPVIYSGIYCENKEKIRKFLTESLALLEE